MENGKDIAKVEDEEHQVDAAAAEEVKDEEKSAEIPAAEPPGEELLTKIRNQIEVRLVF